ncbi:MAG: hypothetical protein ACI4PF_06635 [Christensenellales bacterium]
MKTKKILFLIAGIFNTLLGGMGAFIGVIGLLFNKMLRGMFEASYELVESYIKVIAEQDESYNYLLTASKSEAIDFVMKMVLIVCAVFLIIGLIYIMFGVFNLILSKRNNTALSHKKYLGTLLVVFSWLLMFLNIANILTTIAVYLKPKNTGTQKLYTASGE